MSSRTLILERISAITRDQNELPEIPDFDFIEDVKFSFTHSIKGNKGEVISEKDLQDFLEVNRFGKIISLVRGMEHLSTKPIPADPHELADLEVAIIQGQLGVGENGAIWLTEEDMVLRALPFITEHLVIVLDESALVPNMHVAYQKIGDQHSGFGLFIAGPSKTADIEQSLVIGAHGAKSLRVVLKGD